jgi:hypothetical protein
MLDCDELESRALVALAFSGETKFVCVARLAAIIVWCAVVALLGLAPAAAEKRVALVIGNGAYQKVGKLPNPTNDAKAISGMLQAAGFDAVELHENLGIRELRQAIKDFSDLGRDADIAVVYYSGHGIEVNGVNYLIPTDAVLDRDIDVPYEAYSLENLVQILEPARRLRLVMLDACRDNPFVRSMKRTIGTRAIGRGLAAVEPTTVNTLIGFAAKAGSYALDGDGANSPYATAVLNNLATPGLDLRIAFGYVRDEVLKTTKNKQEPFVYGSLGGGNVSIVDAPGLSAANVPVPQPSTTPVDRAAQAWGVIQNTTSIAVIEDFIRQYGSTSYGSMARARLGELTKSQVASVAPPSAKETPTAPPSTVAEAAQAWSVTQNTTSVAVLEEFIRQFGTTPYGSLARARLEELKKSQVAVGKPPASTTTNQPKDNAASGRCAKIVGGIWDWDNNGSVMVTFKIDGTVQATNGVSGVWTCDGGAYTIRWTTSCSIICSTVRGTISADGRHFSAVSSIFGSFTAARK